MHTYKAQIENQSMFFNFKSFLLYIWCIYITMFLYICLKIQVQSKSNHKHIH
jgi:hypothetical protein